MIDAEQLAKNRFTVLTITRFMDLALVLAGLANVNGKLLPEFTPYLGMVLVIAGAFGFFAVPIVLKRSWAKHRAMPRVTLKSAIRLVPQARLLPTWLSRRLQPQVMPSLPRSLR